MAARALSSGISVVNGKRQSDDHDDQNDEFIVAHMITPFVQRGSQPSAIFFLPAGGCPRIQLITYIYHLSTFLYRQKQPRGTLPCAALTCFIVHAIITAGRDDASALASPLLLLSGAACQFALMAARALSSGISVVNGKRQSDDHYDQNDQFVIGHTTTPFCTKRVSAKRHLFPSCRGLPPHTAYHIYLPFVNISVWTEAAARP